MRISRSGLIGTIVAIAAIAAPSAQAAIYYHPLGRTGPNAQSVRDTGLPTTTPERGQGSRLICTPRSQPMTCRPIGSAGKETASSSRFQFDDAAIGAAAMTGLVLVALAGTLPARRRAQLRQS
jgi:hypothetical protein